MSRLRASLGRAWWTLDRFGLSPGSLGARLRPGSAPRVLCISVPKAGTHLLERALCLHPDLYRKLLPTIRSNNLKRYGWPDRVIGRMRPGQIVMSHLHFDPAANEELRRQGVKTVFLIRDPRDLVVSEAFYLATGNTKHRLHPTFSSLGGLEERMRLLMDGDPGRGIVATRTKLERYAGWLDSGAFVVRFEDLVGAAGGGSDAAQRHVLSTLFEHLGLPPSDETTGDIASRLFSNRSPTFHRGAIGQWREHFDPDIEATFRRVVGEDVMVRYGYAPSPQEQPLPAPATPRED